MTGIRGGIKRGVKFLQLLNAREFAFCAQFEGSLHNEKGRGEAGPVMFAQLTSLHCSIIIVMLR